MGSSLRLGLEAVPPESLAVVIALVDQPFIRPGAVERLIAAFQAGAELAVATYAGKQRNPVLIGRGHIEEVAASPKGTWARAPI